VLTEPFADQIDRVTAYYQTDRPLPAVVLPHPMQNVSADELEERAVLLADAAERLLRGELP
jgi:hypothetical protein